MGLAGTEGVFRRCCEATLQLMKTSREELSTIVQVGGVINPKVSKKILFKSCSTEVSVSPAKNSAQCTGVQNKLHSIWEQNDFITNLLQLEFHESIDHSRVSR